VFAGFEGEVEWHDAFGRYGGKCCGFHGYGHDIAYAGRVIRRFVSVIQSIVKDEPGDTLLLPALFMKFEANIGHGSVTSAEGAEVNHYSARFQDWVQETMGLISAMIFSRF